MRILIIGLGGISRHFRNWPERTLGQSLVRAGHDVYALTYWQPETPHLGLVERATTIDGVRVIRVRPRIAPNRDLASVLRHLPRPDVVHLMHPRNVLAWEAVRWMQQARVPVCWTWLGPFHDRWLVNDRERPYEQPPHPERLIMTVHDLVRRIIREPLRVRDHWRNYAIHAPLRQVNRFIPCSQHEADVLTSLGFGKRMGPVVPLWLDMAFMSGPAPAPPSLTRPIIPYIGQLTIRKCYDMIIDTMPVIVRHYPQASFVFVTHNQAQRADLLRRAAERGVERNLHFLGTISEEEKLALLRASDVLPFPSRYEGFGLPLLEGMAAGVPVVSTDIPVVNEIVVHGDNGLLIPYDDTEALARAILTLLEDRSLRERLIAGGQRALQERFAPERLVRQIIAVYEEVVGEYHFRL